MYAKALSSAPAAAVVTVALLFVMQLLIRTGQEVVVEPRMPQFVDWVRLKEPPPPPVADPIPPRPDVPDVLPPTPRMVSDESYKTGVAIPSPTPSQRSLDPGISFGAFSDGPLINVIKVQPQYPVAAIARGLEGHVIVSFDVSPDGAVENVQVVESTSRVFDDAAVDAAYRFRYKPQVVDGVPQAAQGLQQLFRFELGR